MSLSAAHIRELTALGIAGEVLVRVVEIIEEASDLSSDASASSADKSADAGRGPLESTASEKLERRKNADRIYQKAKRDARKLAEESAKTSADEANSLPTRRLSDSVVLSSSLLPEEPLKESKSSGMRARGTRLAPGTPLSAAHRAIIIAEGIHHDPDKFWEEFVNYWSEVPGRHGVKLRWDGTLRNRCREVIKRGFNGNGNSANRTHQAAGPPQTRDATVIASLARTLEQRRQERAANRPGDEGLSGHAGSAGDADAEPGASRGDSGAHQQLALLPRANASRG